MAEIIRVDGSREEMEVTGPWLDLPDIKKVIDGYFETFLSRRDGFVLLLDDNGKGKALPINPWAMDEAVEMLPGDWIAGDVILAEIVGEEMR